MRRALASALLILALAAPAGAARAAAGFAGVPDGAGPFSDAGGARSFGTSGVAIQNPAEAGISAMTSLPALTALPIDEPALLAKVSGSGGAPRGALNSERARVMLQSLTIPGWGQLSTGHPHAAAVFGTIDLAIWISYISFQVQDAMRTDASIRTAQQFAGIDLRSRSEEYRRIVGSYASSDEYNQLVVYRDAASQFYNDPAAYREYIDKNSIQGDMAWSWTGPEAFDRYRAQRKDAERAALRANTALALAIANRLVSAVHAAGAYGRMAQSHSLRLEVTPDLSGKSTAVRVGLGASF